MVPSDRALVGVQNSGVLKDRREVQYHVYEPLNLDGSGHMSIRHHDVTIETSHVDAIYKPVTKPINRQYKPLVHTVYKNIGSDPTVLKSNLLVRLNIYPVGE